MSQLRCLPDMTILLIDTKVLKDTKIQVAKVKELCDRVQPMHSW